jgi:hypothetical protein
VRETRSFPLTRHRPPSLGNPLHPQSMAPVVVVCHAQSLTATVGGWFSSYVRCSMKCAGCGAVRARACVSACVQCSAVPAGQQKRCLERAETSSFGKVLWISLSPQSAHCSRPLNMHSAGPLLGLSACLAIAVFIFFSCSIPDGLPVSGGVRGRIPRQTWYVQSRGRRLPAVIKSVCSL